MGKRTPKTKLTPPGVVPKEAKKGPWSSSLRPWQQQLLISLVVAVVSWYAALSTARDGDGGSAAAGSSSAFGASGGDGGGATPPATTSTMSTHPLGSNETTDFILVVDDALSAEFCDRLVSRFLTDGRRTIGRAGVEDDSFKRSIDLTLTDHREYEEEVKAVRSVADEALVDYVYRHPHFLFGAVAPHVNDPDTGEPSKLDDDIYARTVVGMEDHPRVRGAVRSLFHRIYRHGALSMQMYQKGSGHYNKFHSEHMPHWEEDGPIHRVLLWMIYLNDVAEGGTTDFFYQNRSITPKKGRLVVAPAAFTHTHRGSVPISGDKFIVTSWLMWKNVQQLGWDQHR